jgi:hypothetical protein
MGLARLVRHHIPLLASRSSVWIVLGEPYLSLIYGAAGRDGHGMVKRAQVDRCQSLSSRRYDSDGLLTAGRRRAGRPSAGSLTFIRPKAKSFVRLQPFVLATSQT